MPLSEPTMDRLTALAQVSMSLASVCEAAKTGADSDDPRTDPLMGTVRKIFLASQALGVEVSRISSGSAPVVRKNASDLFEALNVDAPEGFDPSENVSLRQFQTAVNEVDPTVSFSQIQAAFNQVA